MRSCSRSSAGGRCSHRSSSDMDSFSGSSASRRLRRPSFAPLWDRRALVLGVIVGVLDTGANVLLSLGIASGFASFVMTGSGAYPLIPALLAIAVLRERLAPNQYVGVVVLVAGLVALGLQS